MPTPRKRPSEDRDVTAEKLGKGLDFMRLLWAIEHRLNSTSKYMQKRIGLTGPQRLALRVIERFPGISAGDLANILQLHPSTLTGIIGRLTQRRFIQSVRDQTDRRRLRLQVTNRSHVASARSGTIEDAVRRALRRFTASDIEVAGRMLRAIASTLDDHRSSVESTHRRPSRTLERAE
jgi:DNA-binding MarR family transcriptional regulator